MPQADERLLSTRKLRERYGVTDRTILRWERAGILPDPTWIRKRKHWRLSELERAERAGMGRHSTESVTTSETAPP
jgi:predicted site-specific integrase-resolvase